MEISPGIHQFKVPLPNNPLGYINTYLVKTGEGSLLIDPGWNSDPAFEALSRQVTTAGSSLEDLKYLVVTHLHPDHFGLVRRIKELSQATIILHAAEYGLITHAISNPLQLSLEMDRWLGTNGMPAETRRRSGQEFSSGVASFGRLFEPDWVISGGEHLRLGDFQLEFIWTPGHAPGHLSVYETGRRLLFSGDHVLPDTTPNISMYFEASSNPLEQYLESLANIARLEVDLVLPAHGLPFSNLHARVAEIRAHHEQRLETMYRTLLDGPKTAYQVAAATPWSLEKLEWEDYPPFQQQFALTETIAHLELLVKRGRLRKELRDGLVWYTTHA